MDCAMGVGWIVLALFVGVTFGVIVGGLMAAAGD
jgi:hypothetical protein